MKNKGEDREVIEAINDMLKNIVWYGNSDVSDRHFRETVVWISSRLQAILDKHLDD